MTPEERNEFEKLKKEVSEMRQGLGVDFLGSLKRNLDVGMVSDTQGNASSINTTADSVSVLKACDAKLKVTLSNGDVRYIPIFNS